MLSCCSAIMLLRCSDVVLLFLGTGDTLAAWQVLGLVEGNTGELDQEGIARAGRVALPLVMRQQIQPRPFLGRRVLSS